MKHHDLCPAQGDPDPKCQTCHLIDEVRADALDDAAEAIHAFMHKKAMGESAERVALEAIRSVG